MLALLETVIIITYKDLMPYTTPEHLARPFTLEQCVLDEAAKNTVYLNDLSIDIIAKGVECTPAEISLDAAIGAFMLKNYEAEAEVDMATLDTTTLNADAQAWFQERLAYKVWTAQHTTYYIRKQAEMAALLQDKIMTAQRIDGYTHSFSDGYTLESSSDRPQEVSGKVVGYDPAGGTVRVEVHPDLPEFTYEVCLWDYDPYEKRLTQASSISLR
jgi:hypothetical protein